MQAKVLKLGVLLWAAMVCHAQQAHAADIAVDATSNSAVPQYDAVAGDWVQDASFTTITAHPAKGSLVVTYEFNLNVTLNASAASVTLTPVQGASPVTCTETASKPPGEPSTSDLGTCRFRLFSPNEIHLYYYGAVGTGMSYAIQGIADTSGGNNIVDFDSTSLAGTITPTATRKPVRLLLVLDKSGSMAWSSRPDVSGCAGYNAPTQEKCKPSRWELMSTAVDALLQVAHTYAVPGDEFGAVLFDANNPVSDANTQTFIPLTPGNVGAFLGLLGSTWSPGGGTSFGAGMEKWEDSGDANSITDNKGDFDYQIIALTDGEQNTAPFLAAGADRLDPNVYLNPTHNAPGGHKFVEPGGDETINVCPVGMRFGNPSPDLSWGLDDIAERRCAGFDYIADVIGANAGVSELRDDLVGFFLEFLNGALVGDKLELMGSDKGSAMPVRRAVSIDESFLVSDLDRIFTVHLSHGAVGTVAHGFRLEKDGKVFELIPENTALNAGVHSSARSLTATLRSPFCNRAGECVSPGGEWRLQYAATTPATGAFEYNVFYISDNPKLATSFHTEQALPGIGKPLTLEARIEEGGAPVTGIPQGGVVAVIRGPNQSLGNVLSAGRTDPPAAPGEDSVSTADLKVQGMLMNPSTSQDILAALIAGNPVTVDLTEGDPGVYSAQFLPPSSGVYQVRYLVDTQAPLNGRFTRTFNQSRYVPVAVDDAATYVAATITPFGCSQPGGCYRILLIPQDALGNLVGPGWTNWFRPPTDALFTTPVLDRLDGSYEIRVGYPNKLPPGERPGVDFGSVTLTPPGDGGTGGGPIDLILHWWWLILLLLLLVLAIVWWLLKPGSSGPTQP